MTASNVALGLAIFVVTFSASIFVTAFVLSRMPRDYFSNESPEGRKRNVGVRVAKNILGVVLVALGVFLSLPGVPGQGILTILLGIMLLDFIPGKYKLERKLARSQRVYDGMNKMRAWFKKEPFQPVQSST